MHKFCLAKKQQLIAYVCIPRTRISGHRKFFLDNSLCSFRNTEQALKISRDWFKVLELGGYFFTEFICNVEEITLARNPEVNETPSVFREINDAEQSSLDLA